MNNKQLLQLYVDTGVQLPEYQVRSLPPDLLKTYLRKRIIATENSSTGLADYEFELITPDQRFQYLVKKVDAGVELSEYQIRSLPPDLLETYLEKRLIATDNIFEELSNYELELITPDQRFEYWMKKSRKGISYEQFELLTPEHRFQYAIKIGIWDEKFELLTPKQRFEYAMKRAENGYGISTKQFELLKKHPVDQRFQYVMKKVEKGSGILDKQFELLTPDQRFQYVMKRAENGDGIPYKQFESLTPVQQKIFKDKGGEVWRK